MVFSEVKRNFPPEFVNRIDEMIVFNTLEKSGLKKIFDLFLEDIVKAVAEKKVSLEVKDEVKDYISEKSNDPQYGARPLRRFMQREIENRLAEFFLEHHPKANDHIIFSLVDGKINCSFGPKIKKSS